MPYGYLARPGGMMASMDSMTFCFLRTAVFARSMVAFASSVIVFMRNFTFSSELEAKLRIMSNRILGAFPERRSSAIMSTSSWVSCKSNT